MSRLDGMKDSPACPLDEVDIEVIQDAADGAVEFFNGIFDLAGGELVFEVDVEVEEFLLLLVNLVRRRGFSLISFFLLLR